MEQVYDESDIKDPREKASREISTILNKCGTITPGSRVAIAVGSRGIGYIGSIVAGVVDALKGKGCYPFIVPAMGSHGGDDPLEKVCILEKLGIDEESVGAPVSLDADILQAGMVSDIPVYCQSEALSADRIILINRVKPHTDFNGVIESGLLKMACVGLGGPMGAGWVHSQGYEGLPNRIIKAGMAALKVLPITLGLAIIEGHSGCPVHIEGIINEEILSRERELLKLARQFVPKLPVKKFDVLVVAQMGKDISGTGVDPNVIGRYPSGKSIQESDVPEIYRIAVLDLTDTSLGNASGIGLCDVTTRRLYEKTNIRAMYKNVITSKGSVCGHFPMVMETDREAICVALLTCPRDPEKVEMILIRNTLRLKHFLVSEPLVIPCEQMGAKVIGNSMELSFDSNGSLIFPKWI